MTYETFREKIKEMGFVIEEDDCYEVLVATENSIEYTVLRVLKSCEYVIDTDYASFKELDQVTRGQLYTLANTLACTSLEERKGKFKLRMNGLKSICSYLNYSEITGEYTVDTDVEFGRQQTIFSDSDILEMPIVIQKAIKSGLIEKEGI